MRAGPKHSSGQLTLLLLRDDQKLHAVFLCCSVGLSGRDMTVSEIEALPNGSVQCRRCRAKLAYSIRDLHRLIEKGPTGEDEPLYFFEVDERARAKSLEAAAV
jgi:hypothetical protein